ncbi:hypothetical protein PAHAL_2G340700 [Panicum hallii]|uniref:Uncharacterized protein n=1 Tax=Panicum hallii TaxID=206008 RepID=A0A2T8KRD7_9POAL|nr:hypothetical protein PAHAL_2G340700 [Panicum hallii]
MHFVPSLAVRPRGLLFDLLFGRQLPGCGFYVSTHNNDKASNISNEWHVR